MNHSLLITHFTPNSRYFVYCGDPTPPPFDFPNCYGAVTTVGPLAPCLCWMCFLTSHGSSHQPEMCRPPRQQEKGQPPPHSDDFIRGKGPQYFIEAHVKRVQPRCCFFQLQKMEAPLKEPGEAAALTPAGGCVQLAFTMQSEGFVILGGGSFKENAAMRPSDAFEALIIERNPGV